MIHEITIKNIALIDDLTISFDRGFNVLTGETGAGKSILVDAVNLALGERADRELIQTGKDCARVELLFSLENTEKINEVLGTYGIEPEADGSLLLMRELTIQGKNTCRINGRSVTLSMLREVSGRLVDVHGQHQHQSLLAPESHIGFLDRLGGANLEDRKASLKETWHVWRAKKKEIDGILGRGRDGERRRDILQYQIEELEKAGLRPGEEEELQKERAFLTHAEKIVNAANGAYQELYTGTTGTASVSDRLAVAVGQLRSVRNIDESLDNILDQLENLQYSLEDTVLNLRAYKDQLEFDPLRLETIGTRLDEISSVRRKYGGSVEEVLRQKEEMESERERIDNSRERLEALRQEAQSLYRELLTKCEQVSRIRKQCAAFLEKELTGQLADLNMDKTKFRVSFTTPNRPSPEDPDQAGITENGYDTVEFLISPNPGEPLKPLAKIISGGEMSRVMLAFKTILGDLDEIPTMIFDEIDVGISGRTAQKVAEKIGSISRNRQVICVTHLPQIASMADSHYIIEKTASGNRTRTLITKLKAEERRKEIARMIGGSSLTPLSLRHAGELIESASRHKN